MWLANKEHDSVLGDSTNLLKLETILQQNFSTEFIGTSLCLETWELLKNANSTDAFGNEV